MKEQLQQWLQEITQGTSIIPEDIPKIDLYMDQVLTLLEDQLQDTKRYEDDKIMTKTMINNYSKEKLLPPSNKKKYSKHHIQLLNLIYQYKAVLSIHDIYTLLLPFINDPELANDFYIEHLEQEQLQKDILSQDVLDLEAEDLRLLASSLITRASLEKRLAEKILDHLENGSENKEEN